MGQLLIIAHRGASGYAPEHTFAAWDLALAQGADYLEQDLQLTRDGMLVVMHDETVDRTARAPGCRCTGPVGAHTLAELRDIDVGSWFNEARPELARPEYAPQPLPTLDEVLRRYSDRASFYIETKQPESAPGMEEALLALLRRHDLLDGAERAWRVIVQSFSEASLRLLHGLQPGLPLVQLIEVEEATSATAGRLASIASYAVGIGPDQSRVDPGLVRAAHDRCLAVHPYTVNDAGEQERLLAAGVDGLFTDFPDRLVARRPGHEPRGPAAGAAAAAGWRHCLEYLPPAVRQGGG